MFHVDPWVQQLQVKLCWGHPLQAAHLVRPGGLGEGAGLGDGHDACGLDGGEGSGYPQAEQVGSRVPKNGTERKQAELCRVQDGDILAQLWWSDKIAK